MIGQIGCLGKASSRKGVSAALLYTAGVTLGAAGAGLALGSIGALARWVVAPRSSTTGPGVLLPVALLALAGGLRDLGYLPLRLPQPRRQVPRGWLAVYGPSKTGFLWGLAIGLAYATRIEYSLCYVMALWVLLIGSPLTGAAVLAAYGLAQGGLLVVETAVMARNPRLSDGLLGSGRREAFGRLGGAVLLACGLALAAAWQAGRALRAPPGWPDLRAPAAPRSPHDARGQLSHDGAASPPQARISHEGKAGHG